MEINSLETLLRALPLPSLCIGYDEWVIAANNGATALLGDGLVGRPYISGLRQPDLIDCIEAAFRDGTARTAKYLGSEAGHETTYDVSVAPVDIGDLGRTIDAPAPHSTALLVSFQDTTPLYKAGQMRRDFVANVSHELRTPLTAILGFVETLQGAARDDPDARTRFLGIMQTEATRMNRLIGDLLSLSRVENDARVRPREDVDIAALLHTSAERLATTCSKNEVRIDIDADLGGAMIPGDPEQLMQVFANLLENAIKYGARPGVVTVRATQDPHNAALGRAAMQIDFIDYGEGIENVHLQRLTERFYRIDNHRSREMGGTGLGLAIVKHIVNRHRGRFRISSEIGTGSIFSIILPIS